ncbi:MAG TPA: peptidoglycan-binding protein, partial [Terracidiphilus sp.]
IVNIFETGRLRGDYGSVVVDADDPGHLTYGRSQTTLASGNLCTLISSYCESPAARFSDALQPYLGRLQTCDCSLDDDTQLCNILKQAGGDPAMHRVQDEFFDSSFWLPANRLAAKIPLAGRTGLVSPLAITTVYDSVVHGSFGSLRSATNASFSTRPPEYDWVARYVTLRCDWLAQNKNSLLRKTVYRMEELRKLIAAGNWDLKLPITIRGITITAAALADNSENARGEQPVRASAHDPNRLVLRLQTPHMAGPAVRTLQAALVKDGLLNPAEVDSVYGPRTAEMVKRLQSRHEISADGIVGPATWALVDELVHS